MSEECMFKSVIQKPILLCHNVDRPSILVLQPDVLHNIRKELGMIGKKLNGPQMGSILKQINLLEQVTEACDYEELIIYAALLYSLDSNTSTMVIMCL